MTVIKFSILCGFIQSYPMIMPINIEVEIFKKPGEFSWFPQNCTTIQ